MYYINTQKQYLGTAKSYGHNLLDKKSDVDRRRCHMADNFGVFVNEDHSKLPMLYWLPKLHKSLISLLILAHVLLLSSSLLRLKK